MAAGRLKSNPPEAGKRSTHQRRASAKRTAGKASGLEIHRGRRRRSDILTTRTAGYLNERHPALQFRRTGRRGRSGGRARAGVTLTLTLSPSRERGRDGPERGSPGGSPSEVAATPTTPTKNVGAGGCRGGRRGAGIRVAPHPSARTTARPASPPRGEAIPPDNSGTGAGRNPQARRPRNHVGGRRGAFISYIDNLVVKKHRSRMSRRGFSTELTVSNWRVT
jgi:hypothetical protein